MKLKNFKVNNFGSYPTLELELDRIGLALLHGPTGSGKSTVLDAITWCLYGETAKNIGVDDIKSWSNEELETTGQVEVELPNGNITIHRVRKKGSNDLYWLEATESEVKKRGKDNTETQKRINERLGVNPNLYFSSAYFSEFSNTAMFFTNKAKDRRLTFEQLANLDFATNVVTAATADKKVKKNSLMELEREISKTTGSTTQLKIMIEDLEIRIGKWFSNHEDKIAATLKQIDNFQTDKDHIITDLTGRAIQLESEIMPNSDFELEIEYLLTKINELDKTKFCPHCKSVTSSGEHLEYEKTLSNIKSAQIKNNQKISKLVSVKQQIEQINSLKDQYLQDLEFQQNQANPFLDQQTKLSKSLVSGYEHLSTLKDKKFLLQDQITDLDIIHELSFELRSELLRRVVKDVQDSTNSRLETHFDGDLRVEFVLNGSDDLDVQITKNGFYCSYNQLSKGQRQMLKLCFSVSVMEASANANGVHFSNLFFDEALDGFDSDLKMKAFKLFEQLQSKHEAIIVIDHSEELKTMFNTKFKASMIGDTSLLEADNA